MAIERVNCNIERCLKSTCNDDGKKGGGGRGVGGERKRGERRCIKGRGMDGWKEGMDFCAPFFFHPVSSPSCRHDDGIRFEYINERSIFQEHRVYRCRGVCETQPQGKDEGKKKEGEGKRRRVESRVE